MSTKARFLKALRKEIVDRYPWAADATRLRSFMLTAQQTLDGPKNLVSIDGEAFKAAWRAIGMPGKLTYKGLRSLPVGEVSC